MEEPIVAETRQNEMRAAEKIILIANKILGLNFNEVASALGVDPRTLCRDKNRESTPTPDVRDRLKKMREISKLLEEVFSDQDSWMAWLSTEVPALKGQIPINVVRKGELDEVISILAGLYSRAFV
jgi:uncharacterized protein (DUF2384 family)